MTVQLDHFNPQQKRVYVLVGVTLGLILATVSTILRTWARLISTKKLQHEDWFMFVALFCCIGTASCLYYGLYRHRFLFSTDFFFWLTISGLTTGLGQHIEDLSQAELRRFLIVSRTSHSFRQQIPKSFIIYRASGSPKDYNLSVYLPSKHPSLCFTFVYSLHAASVSLAGAFGSIPCCGQSASRLPHFSNVILFNTFGIKPSRVDIVLQIH